MTQDLERAIDKVDDKLDDHVKLTNERLRDFTELSRTVATAQERQNRHTDDIKRLEHLVEDDRGRMSGLYEKLDVKIATEALERKQSFDRIYNRLDEARMARTQELEDFKEVMNKAQEKSCKRIDGVSEQIEELAKDYNHKSGWAKGALWVLGLVLGAGQLILTSYFGHMADKIDNAYKIDTALEQRIQETEQQNQLLVQQINSLKQGKK